jgi:predicted nucleic acid-binding protein
MTGIDCNILVQLAIGDHPANGKTVAAVKAETQGGEKLVFPPLVGTEFLHVVTDPRRFEPPLAMDEATDWLKDFLGNSSVSLIHPTDSSMTLTLEWMRQHNLGRKRILDTHLAAVFYSLGIKRLLTSNPADFMIFKDLEIIIPGGS